MPLKEIGAVSLALVGIFLLGRLWFHLVEAVLGRIRDMFLGHKEPPPWHSLPPEEDREDS